MDPSAEHGQVPRGSGAGPAANGPTERRRGDRLPSFAQQPAFHLQDAGFPLQPRATSSQTGQPSWDAGGPFDPGNSAQQPTGLPQGHSPHAQHQLPGYRPQLGSPWRQPQRSGPLPQGTILSHWPDARRYLCLIASFIHFLLFPTSSSKLHRPNGAVHRFASPVCSSGSFAAVTDHTRPTAGLVLSNRNTASMIKRRCVRDVLRNEVTCAAPTSSGPLGAYGWLPYPVYGDHTGQPNFFPDNYMAHYPFMYHGAPDFQNFAFGEPFAIRVERTITRFTDRQVFVASDVPRPKSSFKLRVRFAFAGVVDSRSVISRL